MDVKSSFDNEVLGNAVGAMQPNSNGFFRRDKSGALKFGSINNATVISGEHVKNGHPQACGTTEGKVDHIGMAVPPQAKALQHLKRADRQAYLCSPCIKHVENVRGRTLRIPRKIGTSFSLSKKRLTCVHGQPSPEIVT